MEGGYEGGGGGGGGGLQTPQTWQCFQLITSQVVDNYYHDLKRKAKISICVI